MRNLVLVGLMAFCLSANAQGEKPVESKITDVTVFLSRAQVTREGKARIEAGKSALVFQGLTSRLDAQSIQVAGKGKFTILGISHRQNFGKEFSSPRTRSLRDSIELMQQQIILEQSQREVLTKEEQMVLSNQKIGGADRNLTADELKAMANFFRSRLTEIAAQRLKSDLSLKKMNETLSRLQRQLKEVNDLYARHTSEVVVTVSAESDVNAEFELNYVVSNAGWIPVYDLRATDVKSPVQLGYKANVFQTTGEEWKNVRLTLSTANPTLGGVKPELSPLYVDIIEKVIRSARYRDDKKLYKNEAPVAAAMEVAGDVEEDVDATTMADYTSTVQTSLNTEFRISVPYSVTSTSKPTLVDIATHMLKADYLYNVAPKLDQDAFLMASVTGWEEYNLLPGEANIFFEGTFVAKSVIDPENIGDTLFVSLGRDKRIVVKREKIKDFTSRKTLGANQRDTYGFTISIRNTKTEDVRIVVEDQVPVSQNSQVEVTVLDAGGATLQKETGKLRWEFTIKPQETRKTEYRFELKYPKGKRITSIY